MFVDSLQLQASDVIPGMDGCWPSRDKCSAVLNWCAFTSSPFYHTFIYDHNHIDGSVPDCNVSSASAKELLQSCTNPSIKFSICRCILSLLSLNSPHFLSVFDDAYIIYVYAYLLLRLWLISWRNLLNDEHLLCPNTGGMMKCCSSRNNDCCSLVV